MNQRLVAFLRAINVGGHVVRMEDLRRLFEELGFEDVSTFIASGNVVFSTEVKRPDTLLPRITEKLHRVLGYEVPTFLRTEVQVAEIAAYQPFKPADIAEAHGVYVGFLADDPGPPGRKALRELESGENALRLKGKEVYWLSRIPMSESKLTYNAFEKALRTVATFRGVKTIQRLAAKLSEKD